MAKSKVNYLTLDFDYDREQWVKIEQCVCGLSEAGRAALRKAAIEYLSDKRVLESGKHVSPKRRALSWKNVARKCDDLRNEIEKALEYRYGADWRGKLDHPVHPLKSGVAEDLTFRAALQVLVELRCGAEEFSKSFWWRSSIMKTSTGRRDPPIVYLQSILWMWTEDFGGELKISRNPLSGRIGGPLAKYIDAVAAPVMGEGAPSPESYRSLINRQKVLYQRMKEVGIWPENEC